MASIRVACAELRSGRAVSPCGAGAVQSSLDQAWLDHGKIVSPVVLGALFFLVIAPIGVVFRWMGKDLLSLRRDPQVTTYWLIRDPPGPAPESIDDQF